MTPPIEIRVAQLDDASDYLDYVVRNRAFLAPWEPIRPASVFTLAWVRDRIAPSDQHALYIATSGGQVVGQAMLGNFARSAFQNATLGYSVDEHHNGRGIATQLVRHAVREAFTTHGLHRVEAGTLLHNVASQRVLAKCGFTRIGISPRHVQIAGTWQDHVLFATTAEDLDP